jgi:D-aminopeptidase
MNKVNQIKNVEWLQGIPWRYKSGPKNAIIDVDGIRVGHLTISRDVQERPEKKVRIRTGVTAVVPGEMKEPNRYFFGLSAFRNTGEITGYAVTEDFSYLNSPILLTNSSNIGIAYNAVLSYGFELGRAEIWPPVILSVDDSYLNEWRTSSVKDMDVLKLLQHASTQMAEEGSVGIGLGLRAFDSKGGIGTSSRIFSIKGRQFTVGALVASNHGNIGPNPKGESLEDEENFFDKKGSLTMVLATDLPLLPYQIKKVTSGIIVSLPSVNTNQKNSDSIVCVLFSLANAMSLENDGPLLFDYTVVGDSICEEIAHAGLESIKEAVLRSLCLSSAVDGKQDKKLAPIPEERFKAIIRAFGEDRDS